VTHPFRSFQIFKDISSSDSVLPEANGSLKLGQGVSLGNFTGLTYLNFFLKANAYYGGKYVYGADTQANPDGLQHVIAYNYFDRVENQNYVILGFEDLYGSYRTTGGLNQNSDRDFNDVVIAVKGITGDAAVPVPEPLTMMGAFSSVLFGSLIYARRRRNNSQVNNV
jgi:hypothetical protein